MYPSSGIFSSSTSRSFHATRTIEGSSSMWHMSVPKLWLRKDDGKCRPEGPSWENRYNLELHSVLGVVLSHFQASVQRSAFEVRKVGLQGFASQLNLNASVVFCICQFCCLMYTFSSKVSHHLRKLYLHLPAQALQSPSLCDGDRHNLHLWILFTLDLHSPPGGTWAHAPFPDAQLKHNSKPAWSLDFPLPLPFDGPDPLELPAAVDLCLDSSSRSAARRLLRACLLSLFACVLRPSLLPWLGSVSLSIALCPPCITSSTAASVATTGAPLAPAAVQDAAGWCTLSAQYSMSLATCANTHDHGFIGSQSRGTCLFWADSIVNLLRTFSSFSARAPSSARYMSPQHLGHWVCSFSTWREYVSSAAIEQMLSIMHAVRKTCHDAFQAINVLGPGRSFCR